MVADIPAVRFSSFNLKALIFIIRGSLPTSPLLSTLVASLSFLHKAFFLKDLY